MPDITLSVASALARASSRPNAAMSAARSYPPAMYPPAVYAIAKAATARMGSVGPIRYPITADGALTAMSRWLRAMSRVLSSLMAVPMRPFTMRIKMMASRIMAGDVLAAAAAVGPPPP